MAPIHLFFLVCLALVSFQLEIHGQAIPGKKRAVLIGVKEYDHAGFSPLYYSENDVVELAKVLKPQGYDVVLLCDSAGKADEKRSPTRANILRELKATLDQCKRNDLMLVGLAGHGLQYKGEDAKVKGSYFCPSDGHPNRADTLVSLKDLYDQMQECGAGVKLVLVDACRVEVDKEAQRRQWR